MSAKEGTLSFYWVKIIILYNSVRIKMLGHYVITILRFSEGKQRECVCERQSGRVTDISSFENKLNFHLYDKLH